MIDTGHIEGVADQVYYNSNVVQFRPLENVTGSSFAGQATFEIDIAKDEMYMPRTFYMGARVSIITNRPGDNTEQYLLNSDFTNRQIVGCIASGGINNIFSKAVHEVGGVAGSNIVQNINDYPEACGLLRQSHEHPLSAKTNKTDIINYIETSKIPPGGGTNTRIADTNSFFEFNNSYSQSPFEYVLVNGKKQGCDTQKTFTLTSRLPFAMFMGESKLYQGKHLLRFTVSNTWRENLVNVLSSTAAAANNTSFPNFQRFTGTYTDAKTNPGGAEGNVGITIEDIYIYGQCVKINKRPIGKHMMMFENFNVTSRSLTGNDSENFLLPIQSHLLKLIMGFRTSVMHTTNSVVDPAPLNPVAHFGFNKIPISQIRIKYLSDTYPQVDYNMRLVDTIYNSSAPNAQNFTLTPNKIPASTTSTIDTARAYEDYYNYMEYEDSTKCMTFNEWLNNPIFVFNFCSTTNTSRTIEVFIGTSIPSEPPINMATMTPLAARVPFTNPLNKTICWMLYVYRTMVEVDYGEDSVSYKVFDLV